MKIEIVDNEKKKHKLTKIAESIFEDFKTGCSAEIPIDYENLKSDKILYGSYDPECYGTDAPMELTDDDAVWFIQGMVDIWLPDFYTKIQNEGFNGYLEYMHYTKDYANAAGYEDVFEKNNW